MRIAPQWNEFKKECGRELVSDTYCEKTLAELCEIISAKMAVEDNWQTVEKVMTAERRLKGLASNRRILDENGKSFATRWSMCDNEELKELPVGVIDPILRTIGFAGKDGKIIVALHFYASHPMVAYRREMVSQDVPGVALDYVAKNFDPETMNIYLNGCAGNITFGKYFTGDKEESLVLLGERLGKGLLDNLNNLEGKNIGKLDFVNATFDFPLDPSITEEAMTKKLEEIDDKAQALGIVNRLLIARNWDAWQKCTVSRMSIGDAVHFLSLPAEICVEYQLYAQSLVPEDFLACAAYGNCTYHYIPTAQMYNEGGYEPEYGSISTTEVESRLKAAIAEVLVVKKPLH